MRRRHAPLLSSFLLAGLALLLGADIHVSGTGDDAGGDGRQGSPFRTITRGMSAAGPGDAVRVHAGTYDEAAGEVFPIDKRPGVAVVGDDPSVCVVRGVPTQPVFRFPPSDLYTRDDPLEGLTIEGGRTGVLLDFAEELARVARPMITRNVIRNNVGDGIQHYTRRLSGEPSESAVSGTLIEANGGAGISVGRFPGAGNIDLRASGNVIRLNAEQGISLYMSDNDRAHFITNNIIRENGSTGLELETSYFTPTTAIVTNNVIVGNGGAGILFAGYLGQGGADGPIRATIANNTVADNTGVQILCEGRIIQSVVTNTIAWGAGVDIWGDTTGFGEDLQVTWSDFVTIEGNVDVRGPGNISQDPLPVDPANGDYRLSSGSPCIDAGTSEGAPAFDLSGNPRVDVAGVANTGGGAEPWYDMGAYEFVGMQDADGDTVGDLADCDDQNGQVWREPGEVGGLEVRRSGEWVELEWAVERGGGEDGTVRYDVAWGVVADLGRDGGYGSAACLVGGLGVESHVDVRGGPPAGTAWYYLVRAANDCPGGSGTFGDARVAPDPRDLLDDPALSPVEPCPP